MSCRRVRLPAEAELIESFIHTLLDRLNLSFPQQQSAQCATGPADQIAKNRGVKKKKKINQCWKENCFVVVVVVVIIIVLNFPFLIQEHLLKSNGKHQNDQLFHEALPEFWNYSSAVNMELTLRAIREQQGLL